MSAATRSKTAKGRGAARRAATRRQPNPAIRRALRREGSPKHASQLVLGRANYLLMGAGVVAIVLGFVLLADGEISFAPLLLVLGYCILIPAGLLLRGEPWRRQSDGPTRSGEESEGE